MDEETAFARAYMNKMGLTLSPRQRELFNPATVGALLGVGNKSAEDTLTQVRRKLESVQGFPVVTETTWTSEEDPRAVAANKEAAAKRAYADDDGGVDLANGVQGAAGSLLGGFAKRKMKQRSEQKAAEREALPLFSTYSEVVSLETSAVPASQFEVPAGFRKTN
jgi:hypothetical protein